LCESNKAFYGEKKSCACRQHPSMLVEYAIDCPVIASLKDDAFDW
jgi:hypothetical protein